VRQAAAVAALACVAVVAAAPTAAPSTERAAEETTYSLSRTVACLEKAKARVTRIQPRDRDLRALRDLAQRTSRQAVVRRQLAAFAVVPSVANAKLLVELLQVPGTPYRIVRVGNAVILHRPMNATAFRAVRGCLRS
jgi:hypothetical protein